MANASEVEVAELQSILSLTLEGAKARAVELHIKRKGVGWGKDGTPELKKDAILTCIIGKTFNLKELELLAKAFGIKKPGLGWGKEGTPPKTKQDIASSLFSRKKEVMSRRPSEGATGEDPAAEDSAADAGDAATEDEEETPAEERSEEAAGSLAAEITAKMLEDFTLSDLVDLAKQYGVKREGVNWGKDGTPPKRRADIIAALIAKAQGESPDDLEAPRGEDGQLVDIDTGNWCNFQVEEGPAVPLDFMPRTKYRAHLEGSLGLSAHQDVFHIIASANGGPDHPDNYLGALGSSFNRSLGCSMDFFCCFIAGLEKTQRAVERALQAEELYRQDPDKYARLIDSRGKKDDQGKPRPTLYSENAYNRAAGHCLTAEELVEQGRLAWAKMRLAAVAIA